MNHISRIKACLAGQTPDRTPVALWRHFPVDDQYPERLAEATIQYQRTFDFDIVKVTPASSFAVRDWGMLDVWKGHPEGTREYVEPVVKSPQDWKKIKPVPAAEGFLGQQLKALELIIRELGGEVPILQTIFNPLSQAKNLVGKPNLVWNVRMYPDEVLAALEVITGVIKDFIHECKNLGVDGVFYAIQHANYALMNEEEYSRFGKDFDLDILAETQDLWFNMLHLHGENVMFDLVADYPVQAINWHDRETLYDLKAAQEKFPGLLVGGLKQEDTMVLGTPESVTAEALDAIQSVKPGRLMLGTGCVTPTIAPYGNIMAARRSVD